LFLLVTFSITLLFGQAIWLSNLSILSVPDEGYSINTSSALHLIFSFLKMIYKFSRNSFTSTEMFVNFVFSRVDTF
jgi:hypothetical protein